MKEDTVGGPAFIYTGIRVRDMEESINFYTGMLNMTIADKRERTEPTKDGIVTLKSRHTSQLLELNWYASDSPCCSETGTARSLAILLSRSTTLTNG